MEVAFDHSVVIEALVWSDFMALLHYLRAPRMQ